MDLNSMNDSIEEIENEIDKDKVIVASNFMSPLIHEGCLKLYVPFYIDEDYDFYNIGIYRDKEVAMEEVFKFVVSCEKILGYKTIVSIFSTNEYGKKIHENKNDFISELFGNNIEHLLNYEYSKIGWSIGCCWHQ